MQKELLHENKKLDQPKLLHLDLETSSACNFNCHMCPRPTENGSMDIHDIKYIIKQFADMGGETIKPFWRGEPTLDQRMPEILAYAKSLNLKTMINTNGSDKYNILKKCFPNLDWISFSIDEFHNNINDNTFCNLVYSTGVEYIEVQASKYNYFVEYYCTNNNIPYKVDQPTKRSNNDTTSEVIKGERKYCGFPDWRMVVAYNGDCTLCCVDWELENNIGNAFKKPLEDIFYNGKALILREELKQSIYTTDICKQCPSRSAYV